MSNDSRLRAMEWIHKVIFKCDLTILFLIVYDYRVCDHSMDHYIHNRWCYILSTQQYSKSEMRMVFQIDDTNPIPLHIHHIFDTQEEQNSSIDCIQWNHSSVVNKWMMILEMRWFVEYWTIEENRMMNRSKKKRMGNRIIEKRMRDCEERGIERKKSNKRTQWEYQIHWFPESENQW